MDIFTRIERNNYAATDTDVEKLAASHYEAASAQGRVASTYFRILLAASQVELTGKPVLRLPRGKSTPVDGEAQLKAIDTAHAHLYAAVRRGIETPDVAAKEGLSTDEQNRRTAERNRRTNYARTSAYALRRYVKAGGDLRRLVVTDATKNGVTEATPTDGSASAEGAAARKIQRAAARAVAAAKDLAGVDKPAAEAALRAALNTMTETLNGLGVRSTDKPEVAMRDARPLKTPVGTFYPMLH